MNRLPSVNKKNKFGATKTNYKGVKYDSKKEAWRAFQLDALKKKGEIIDWEGQVKFPIIINDVKICDYIADFKITYPDGRIEYEDVKGYKKGTIYRMFRIKKSLVKALYNIEIIEV